jgi:hypothetical protein
MVSEKAFEIHERLELVYAPETSVPQNDAPVYAV